jgi:hypothetical protein
MITSQEIANQITNTMLNYPTERSLMIKLENKLEKDDLYDLEKIFNHFRQKNYVISATSDDTIMVYW